MRWLLIVFLIACGDSGGGSGGGGRPDDTGKDKGTDKEKDKEKEKNGKPLPVAKPAPAWCDGKKCPCKDGDEKATESYKSCELSAQLVVQGVPCGKGRVEFWPDGKLKKCDLAAPVMVGDYTCQVGVGILWLHKDGSLKRCHVKGSYKIDGYQLGSRFGAFDLELYANKKLKDGEIQSPVTIGKQACAAGKLQLYPDGKVYSCTSAAPVVVDDTLTLPKETPVLLGADGSLTGFFPQSTVTYKGEEKKAGWAVCIVKDCNTVPASPD